MTEDTEIRAALHRFAEIRARLWDSNGGHCADWVKAAHAVYTATLKYERDFNAEVDKVLELDMQGGQV